jgi:hypothetical protein
MQLCGRCNAHCPQERRHLGDGSDAVLLEGAFDAFGRKARFERTERCTLRKRVLCFAVLSACSRLYVSMEIG